MSTVQSLAMSAMKTAIGLAPASWLPGGKPDPLATKHGSLGKTVTRIDGPLKVKGEATFAGEFRLPGMVHAALAFSTVARGRIVSLRTAEAEAAPGVVFVMTHENAPRMKAPPIIMSKPLAAGSTDLPVMQDPEIHWNGQPIAVVLAETVEQAEYAASLVTAEYEVATAITSFAAAQAQARLPSSIMGEDPDFEKGGDAEKALAEAPHRVDLSYRTPRHNHNAIELHAVTLAWEGDNLRVHDASQLVNASRWTLADIFGIKEENVRVTSPYVGGGFGGKCFWDHQILAAAASRASGRPVRMMLTREGVYRVVGGRTCTEQRVALGAREDGTLLALIHEGVVAMTTHNEVPEQFTFPARHLYATKTLKLVQKVADMDMLANTFMRAPGEAVGTFALECALDELAHDLKLDPVELRRRLEPETDPASGAPFSSRHMVEAFRAGAEAFGWDKRDPAPRQKRDGEWLIGMGVATATYPYSRMPGGKARLTVTADGEGILAMASHEMGMGTATTQAQHAADRLGLPIDKVRFDYGDTDLPQGTLAGGSTQTASIGAAAMAAHAALVKELIRLAGNDSPIAGLSADEVETRDGGIGAIDDPARFETYGSILARAGRQEVSAEAAAPLPVEHQKWSMHSYGAQFCEVRVNEVTGETRVSRFLGSFDAGRILNPQLARSQFRGGIIMGLGLALMEETFFDERTGRIMNPSLAEYHVPVHLDVPKIDILWTNEPDPHAPMGARGIGEIGITGVGAAVANAVFNATGKRIRELPITLDKTM